jgi:hypothetical protein
MQRKADTRRKEEAAQNAALKKQMNPEPSYEEKRFNDALEALTANMALDELDVLEAIARRHCPELHEKIYDLLGDALSMLYCSSSLPQRELSREELSSLRREVENYLMCHSTPKSPAKSLPRKRASNMRAKSGKKAPQKPKTLPIKRDFRRRAAICRL